MPTTTDTEPEGRRARLRREALEQIKAAALDQVRTNGAADVSLRAIAREAGMSPAGLYRYFDGRDALLTALIADSFDRLAATIRAATDREPERDHAARLLAALRAYREWSVTHPHEFGLVFGNPIPGYQAPPDGETVVAMTGVSVALFTPLFTLWREGRVAIPPSFDDTPWDAPIAGLADQIGALMGEVPVPASMAGAMLAMWGRLHGMVALEVFGQLDWVYPRGSAQLFEAEMAALLATVLR